MNRSFAIHIGMFLTLTFFSLLAKGAFLSNGFVVTSQYIDGQDKSGKCRAQIFYPNFSSNNEIATAKINETIQNYIKNYNIRCNKKTKQPEYKIYFDVRTGSNKYFSVRILTMLNDGNKDKKPIKIESLNFNITDGRLLSTTDIIKPIAKNLMHEIVKLSDNKLAIDTAWPHFLEKVEKKQVQFYIFESKWYIVFNPVKNRDDNVVESKLPVALVNQEGLK